MPEPVMSVVADPDFAKLSTTDQQGVLAHFDPAFGKLGAEEIPGVVSALQRKGLSRPDQAAPPGVATPQPPPSDEQIPRDPNSQAASMPAQVGGFEGQIGDEGKAQFMSEAGAATGAGLVAGAAAPTAIAAAKTASPYVDKMLGSHTMGNTILKYEAYKWGFKKLLELAFGRDKK